MFNLLIWPSLILIFSGCPDERIVTDVVGAKSQQNHDRSSIFARFFHSPRPLEMLFCTPCNGRKERHHKNAVEDIIYPVCRDEDSLTEGMSSASSSSTDACSLDGGTDSTFRNETDPYRNAVVVRMEDLNEAKLVTRLEELLHDDRRMRTMGSIEIRGCNVCLQGARAIRKVLQVSYALHDFTFCLNRVSESGICMIAQGIRQNLSLESLDLSSNSLNDESVVTICDTLASNTCITRLCLDFNDFGLLGIEAVASMLTLNSTLKELQLFGNKIDSRGTKCLAGGLVQNTSLHRLVLTFNQIGNEGAAALAEALSVNTTLRKLSIAANDIHLDGLTALGTWLPQMKGVEYLDVGDVYNMDEAEALASGLERNTRLVTLFMESPSFGDSSTIESRIDFCLRFNRCGRSLLHTVSNVPGGLWLRSIAKACIQHRGPNGSPDVLYAILRGRPDLLDIDGAKHSCCIRHS